MSVIYEDNFVQLHHADYRDHLDALAGMNIDAIVTDPPYGETSLKWDRWPTGWLDDAAQLTNALWCWGSFRMFHVNAAEYVDAGWKFSHEVVWEKQNGTGFATDKFRRVHELATFWYRGAWADVQHNVPRIARPHDQDKSSKRGSVVHTGTIEPVRYRDDGYRLTPTVLRVNNEQSRAIHPTQKPVGVIAPLIQYSVPDGGIVVDPFAGSATTALVARRLGRRCIAFEAQEQQAQRAAERLAVQEFILEDAW